MNDIDIIKKDFGQVAKELMKDGIQQTITIMTQLIAMIQNFHHFTRFEISDFKLEANRMNSKDPLYKRNAHKVRTYIKGFQTDNVLELDWSQDEDDENEDFLN